MKAILVLDDGSVYEGRSLGAAGRTYGEAVFNTSMAGYQEVLSDPSYAGQIVCLTYPLIGNYGINDDDFESRKIQVEGFVVREACETPSNWRSRMTLDECLKEHQIVGIKDVDTRALTRRLRSAGVMMGAISTDETPDEALTRLRQSPAYSDIDFVRRVSTEHPYVWPFEGEPKHDVALLDFGVKFNIMRCLAKLGCRTTVWPCATTPEKILERRPAGVMLSPGPGDPARLGYLVATTRALAERVPLFGVCLGNQMLGCAFGAGVFKLKFGHRGGNHPSRDLETGRVCITSQNHGYALDPSGLTDGMEVAHINLNDGTVEGLRHRELPVFSIQYHPEASPGPHDSAHFFKKFVAVIEGT